MCAWRPKTHKATAKLRHFLRMTNFNAKLLKTFCIFLHYDGGSIQSTT